MEWLGAGEGCDDLTYNPSACSVGGYKGKIYCRECELTSCELEERCGDGIINGNETCDTTLPISCNLPSGQIGARVCVGCNLTSCIGEGKLCEAIPGVCVVNQTNISSGKLSLGRYDCQAGEVCAINRTYACENRVGALCQSSCGDEQVGLGTINCGFPKECCQDKPRLNLKSVVGSREFVEVELENPTLINIELSKLRSIDIKDRSGNKITLKNLGLSGDFGKNDVEVIRQNITGKRSFVSFLKLNCNKKLTASALISGFDNIDVNGSVELECVGNFTEPVVVEPGLIPIPGLPPVVIPAIPIEIKLECSENNLACQALFTNRLDRQVFALFLLKDSKGLVKDYVDVPLPVAVSKNVVLEFENCPASCPCSVSWKIFTSEDVNFVDPLPALTSFGREVKFICKK